MCVLAWEKTRSQMRRTVLSAEFGRKASTCNVAEASTGVAAVWGLFTTAATCPFGLEFSERPGRFDGICGFCRKQQRCPCSRGCDGVHVSAAGFARACGQHGCCGVWPGWAVASTDAACVAIVARSDKQKAAELAQLTKLSSNTAAMNLRLTVSL